MSLVQSALLIFLLILISGFFSISEIALASARKLKLEQLLNEGESRAALVLDLQAHPGIFFTAVQIGLNTVAILAGVIGEGAFASPITSLLLPFIDPPSAKFLGVLLSFLLVTSLFILFADLIPKRIGMVLPEKIAVHVVKPIKRSVQLLKPFIWIFNGLANLFFLLFHLPAARVDEVTLEDIVALAHAGTQAGVLDKAEQQVIENLLELELRTAPSTMTARENIVWIDRQDSAEIIKAKITSNPHAKYPLCIGNIDQVVGYVDSKDILSQVLNGETYSPRTDSLLRNVLILPETLTLSEILAHFKSSREDFALILNEYALVVGLITLNDVTGTLMGDMVSPQIEEQIVQREDGSWLVDGITTIGDVMQVLGIDSFPEDENYETIAGFMMYALRKVPKRTDFTLHGGYKFEVVDIDNFKIDQLLVTRLEKN
ncbi:MAG: hemolysin family protein [Legionella sp.]|nr:hemolysin family protein [Legionella sp.]